jgi:hypothetical protein
MWAANGSVNQRSSAPLSFLPAVCPNLVNNLAEWLDRVGQNQLGFAESVLLCWKLKQESITKDITMVTPQLYSLGSTSFAIAISIFGLFASIDGAISGSAIAREVSYPPRRITPDQTATESTTADLGSSRQVNCTSNPLSAASIRAASQRSPFSRSQTARNLGPVPELPEASTPCSYNPPVPTGDYGPLSNPEIRLSPIPAE